jgi:hypothetical protein
MDIEDFLKGVFMTIGGAIIIVAALIYASLSYGFVIANFWAWFIMPIFESAPALKVTQAFGLALFLGSLRVRIGNLSDLFKKSDLDEASKALNFLFAVAIPWLILLLGFLFKTFLLR